MTLGRPPTDPKIRFRQHFVVGEPNHCWDWQGNKASSFGYGLFSLTHTKRVRAHRFAWELRYGPVPTGKFVLHRCDNPLCVNPRHLFLGTHADNVADKVAKGRESGGSMPGATNPSAKLTEADIEAIRADLAKGHRYIDIAAKHGIGKSMVGNIATGKNWRHS